MQKIQRLPEVRSLSQILPSGTEGGKEFARIVDLLLFYSALKRGQVINLFSDRSGDFGGLDSYDSPVVLEKTGYQYKYFPSPLSTSHRNEIKEALRIAAANSKKTKIKKWILVTPDDLTESATRKDGGDVSWFENLKATEKPGFEIEHWGHRKIQALFIDAPSLCLFYYPDLVSDGASKARDISTIKASYLRSLSGAYRNIEFVGMSVYKPEATRGIAMEDIYIPISATLEKEPGNDARHDPLTFLGRGRRQVLLGDPGSGKSTLLKFLSLAGHSAILQKKYKAKPDDRLPILIVLRKYAEALRDDPNLSILSYISRSCAADFSLNDARDEFFEYFLETGSAVLLFDGIDELATLDLKKTVRDRISSFVDRYPSNTTIITSRIVGYSRAFGFDDRGFVHFRVAPLLLEQMDQFVSDWYSVRIEDNASRDANVSDLKRIFRNPEQSAIRMLAENPLLLTIITLVHRIDAVLPDERVVLYQKCTETLLNTWHSWKFREAEERAGRGRIERKNRQRVEALAYEMQCSDRNSPSNGSSRAVLDEDAVLQILTRHITSSESISPEDDASDLAIDFLNFIKQRAGLLIEVGDKRYSFIHLTFQEYLTASRLSVSMELGGVETLWQKEVQSRISDPRWHEVLRLLVASLHSDASQNYLTEKILAENKANPTFGSASLLAGLLTDGIRRAEELGAAIIEAVLLATCTLHSDDDRRRALNLARGLHGKYDSAFNVAYRSIWSKNVDLRHILLLIALSMGVAPDELSTLADDKRMRLSIDDIQIIALIFGDAGPNGLSQRNCAAFDRWACTQSVLMADNSEANAAVASSFGLFKLHPLSRELESIVKIQFSALLTQRGPFEDLYQNWMKIGDKLDASNYFDSCAIAAIAAIAGGRKRPPSHIGLPRLSLFNAALRECFPTFREVDARGNVQFFKSREVLRERVKIDTKVRQKWALHTRTSALESMRSRVLIDMLCDCFDLSPKYAWSEAIFSTFFGRSNRPRTILTSVNLENITQKIEASVAVEADYWLAASFMLFDIWLYAFEGYAKPVDSPVKRLAELVELSEWPVLRLVHAVRASALGDVDGVIQTVNIISAEDPDVVTFLDGCGLVH